ncbi:Mss4-like protein [Dactylonectria estremocensis]|uniref:Mss4-like protein n=1 Tax=Dactylonectria estremocensis TaxID=1079267 RepID=A0A9P9J054_9HYPO|nr:Mss4-like protein [Dactylonectria estremocensis]
MAATTGGCLCGACAYSYAGNPAIRALCYCGPCRKISGGTNTVNVGVPEADFSVTKGQPKSYAMQHQWGLTLSIFFCPECATVLWKTATDAGLQGMKIVQAGTLSDVSQLNEKIDVEFYSPERPSWLTPVDNADQRAQF